jgi:HK97 family phage major capsid protein
MNMKLSFARKNVHDLSAAALAIYENKALSPGQRMTAAAPLELDCEKWVAEVRSLESVEVRKASFGGHLLDMGAARGASAGLGSRGRPYAPAPSLDFTDDQIQALFRSAKSAQSFRLETKDASNDTNNQQPPTLLPGIVERRAEPTRILDHLSTTGMDGPSIEFLSHSSTTGGAGTVAPGALKPAAVFTTTPTILTARKLAVVTGVVDELLEDFPSFLGWVQLELRRLIISEENAQILSGDGLGDNLQGLLTTSGILTRAQGTDTGLDCLEQALTDLRTGPSFTAADTIILNPATFSKLRRSKNTVGDYILNPDPSAAEASSIFGVPVLVTTQMPAGEGIVANLRDAATAFIRRGLTVESTQNNGDDFIRNRTTLRCEERLALGVQRPTAVVRVSGLGL